MSIDATELCELFSRVSVTRSSGNEAIDHARVLNADFVERETVLRLAELRRRWRHMGVQPR
jgi:hypothetical protein